MIDGSCHSPLFDTSKAAPKRKDFQQKYDQDYLGWKMTKRGFGFWQLSLVR